MTYDLTGVSPSWPPDLEQAWASCVSDAIRAPDAWHGPGSGDSELIEALGALLGVDPGRIIITAGIRAAAVAIGAVSPAVLIERPTFAQIPRIFQSLGRRVQCAAWPALAALSQTSPGTVWVTSPARNPDGAAIETRLATRLRDAAAAGGGFMVVNETYSWYEDFAAPAGCVRLGSLSKLAGGGARLGWVIDAPPKAERALGKLGPPTSWQRAWARFLRATGRERLIAEFVRPVQDARNAFFAAAGELAGRLAPPGAGPSILVPLGESITEEQATRLLASRGISVGAGSDFLAERPSIRLAFTGLTTGQARHAGQLVGALLADEPRLIGEPDPIR